MDMQREWAFGFGGFVIGAIVGALIARYFQSVGLGGSLGFEEQIVSGGHSVESSRLGVGEAVLVYQYLNFMPDKIGTYKIEWGFANYIGGVLVWSRDYVGAEAQSHNVTSITQQRVQLLDKDTSKTHPEYNFATFFDTKGFDDFGYADGKWRTVEHRIRVYLTSPSGKTLTLNATWSDTMRAWVMSGSLEFAEAIVR
jgi:hypothetical protein